MIQSVYTDRVTIKRRTSQGRDALNNPIYGSPTSGAGWATIYTDVPCRLAFSSDKIEFTATGERILPGGVMYFSKDYIINQEDRVLTENAIEYVVVSVVPGYNHGKVLSHFEADLALP